MRNKCQTHEVRVKPNGRGNDAVAMTPRRCKMGGGNPQGILEKGGQDCGNAATATGRSAAVPFPGLGLIRDVRPAGDKGLLARCRAARAGGRAVSHNAINTLRRQVRDPAMTNAEPRSTRSESKATAPPRLHVHHFQIIVVRAGRTGPPASGSP